MKRVLPVLVRFRTKKPEIAKLLKDYWSTIDQCVAAKKIVAELKAAGFQNVERHRTGPILNDYFARKES